MQVTLGNVMVAGGGALTMVAIAWKLFQYADLICRMAMFYWKTTGNNIPKEIIQRYEKISGRELEAVLTEHIRRKSGEHEKPRLR